MLRYQYPQIADSDIPHSTKLRDEILSLAKETKLKLGDALQNVPGQISITFDAWTSKSYDPYLAVTAHYIAASPLKNKSNEWELRARTLAFTAIDGDHGGANIAAILLKIFEDYGLSDKVGWVTSDNATSNDKAMRILQRSLNTEQHPWLAQQRRIRYEGQSNFYYTE